MISSLKGYIESQEDGGKLVVVCGGVGYAVVVNERDRANLNVRGSGQEHHLVIRARYREGEPTLYGFLSYVDRGVFDRICEGKNLGPTTAMRILGLMDAYGFEDMVAKQAWGRLHNVKGIGAKMIDNLIATFKA